MDPSAVSKKNPTELPVDRNLPNPLLNTIVKNPDLTPIESWQSESFAAGPWNAMHAFVPVLGWKEQTAGKKNGSMEAERGSTKGA
jgi:hypothetical protein